MSDDKTVEFKGFHIHELKNDLFERFCAENGLAAVDLPEAKENETAEETTTRLAAESKNGRFMLLGHFIDDLENVWNFENREALKKTNCEKVFLPADILRFADVGEVTDETPQPLKDRVAFAEFLKGVAGV